MKKLLKKEFMLALHPTSIIFLFFAVFVFIPNYIYEAMFFFSCLSIFFICLTSRENKDIYFTATLPVEKKKIALARIFVAIILQLTQLVLVSVFIILKTKFINLPNIAGLEANMAFIGVGFIILGAFNLIFFPLYFKNPNKVGVPFIITSIVIFFIVCLNTILVNAVPFIANNIDIPDTVFSLSKLFILIGGMIIYILFNIITCILSVKIFKKTDL